jgi:hypothetical protein
MAVHAERMCAQLDGDFVVFLIGMRINKPWKIGAADGAGKPGHPAETV